MSTLITNTISTIPQEQKFKLRSKTHLRSLRLMLYLQNSPTGNLIIKIKKGATTLITSTTAMSTLIAATTDDYAYGMFNFDCNLVLEGNNTEHTITVESSESGSLTNQLGWCRDWLSTRDDLYGDEQTDGTPDYNVNYNFKFDLITYKG